MTGILLVPEVKVDHPVTGATARSIGKQDIAGQSAELGPKMQSGLSLYSNTPARRRNQLSRAKMNLARAWPPVAVCSRQNLDGAWDTPWCRPGVVVVKPKPKQATGRINSP